MLADTKNACEIPETDNILLSTANLKMMALRPEIPANISYSIRDERCSGGTLTTVWFKSGGCRYDSRGQCIICDYGGRHAAVSSHAMVDAVKRALARVPSDASRTLLVSPSGSMMDAMEVPVAARNAIWELVAGTACSDYICETRPETVSDSAVECLTDLMKGRRIHVEMGFESASQLVRECCINKGLALSAFTSATEVLKNSDVGVITNVLLGSPFLSIEESIADTEQSIRWAFAHGADECVVFPVHVRQGTLLEWLWRHRLYRPPSLWSLVEVLRGLGETVAPRITMSWHKVYDMLCDSGDVIAHTDLGYLASPTTCHKCAGTVLGLLDEYRYNGDFAVVDQLSQLQCECKDRWTRSRNNESGLPLRERLMLAYEAIGVGLLGAKWWGANADRSLAHLRNCQS